MHVTQSDTSLGGLLRVCWWLPVFCLKSVIFSRQREICRNPWKVKWVYLTMEENEKRSKKPFAFPVKIK